MPCGGRGLRRRSTLSPCVSMTYRFTLFSSHNPSHMVASPAFMALTPLGSTAPRASSVCPMSRDYAAPLKVSYGF